MEKSTKLYKILVQNIKNSGKILLLMLCKMSLKCIKVVYISDIINDELSFLAIPIA